MKRATDPQIIHPEEEPLEKHPTPDYQDGEVFILDQVKDLPPDSSNNVRLPINTIILCIKGKMQMDVNGKPVIVQKDEVLMCPPNVILSDSLFSSDFECKIMGVTDRILQSFLRSNVTIWNQAVYISKVTVFPTTEAGITFFNYLYELLRIEIHNPHAHFRREMIHSLINSILLAICNSLAEMTTEELSIDPSRKDLFFRNFLQLLGSSAQKRHPVKYYADKLHISPKYLSIICRRSSGKSALEWIDNYVLEDVRFSLRNTDLSIKQVADKLGFANLSFFGKYIRRHLKMSPKDYRRTLRQ